MPDLPSPEDDAALYVLNGLSAGERRDFESRLAQSADLHALVRELEEGTTALALARRGRIDPWQLRSFHS